VVLPLALHGRDNVKWYTHAVFAVFLGAILGYILGSELTVRFFIITITASILPDFAEKSVYDKHKRQLHNVFSIVPCVLTYLFLDLTVGAALTAGIISHLLLDCLTPAGCPLLMPLSRRRYSVKWRYSDTRAREKRIVATAVVLALLTVLAVAASGTFTSAISSWANRDAQGRVNSTNSTNPGLHLTITNPQRDTWVHPFPNGSYFIDVSDSSGHEKTTYHKYHYRPGPGRAKDESSGARENEEGAENMTG